MADTYDVYTITVADKRTGEKPTSAEDIPDRDVQVLAVERIGEVAEEQIE